MGFPAVLTGGISHLVIPRPELKPLAQPGYLAQHLYNNVWRMP